MKKDACRPGNDVDLYVGISRKSPWADKLDQINAIVDELVEKGVVAKIAQKYY